MASTDGSRAVHDRYLESCGSAVGLHARGGKCWDDACISGIFDWPSIPSVYRSSRNSETDTGIGATTTVGIVAIGSATALATATGPKLGTIGADSSTTDGSKPRCQGEWYRTGEV